MVILDYLKKGIKFNNDKAIFYLKKSNVKCILKNRCLAFKTYEKLENNEAVIVKGIYIASNTFLVNNIFIPKLFKLLRPKRKRLV